MFLFNLLEESSSSSSAAAATKSNWWIWIVLGVFLVAWIVMSYFTNKKRKAQADAETAKRNAIKPGFTVTTIGGIVGTVVAVDDENNTFVLQTGDEERPSLLKFDKLAIYNSVDPEAGKDEPIAESTEENNTSAEESSATENADAEVDTASQPETATPAEKAEKEEEKA